MPLPEIEFEVCPPLIRADGSSEQITHRRSCRLNFLGACEPSMLLHCEQHFDVHWLKLATYKRHRMDSLGIEYVREGSLTARENGREYRVMPGEIFLVLPDSESEVCTGPEEYCVKSSLLISGSLLPEIIRRSRLNEKVLLQNIDHRNFERLLENFLQLSHDSSHAIRRRCGKLCYELLEFLASPAPEPGVPEAMVRVEAYIRDHLAEPLTADGLARLAGCSTAHLNRQFSAAFGMTPHHYWLNRRLRYAAELLLSRPELSVKEAAAEAGFDNALNFSTAFRKHFGVSPREYRRRLLPDS